MTSAARRVLALLALGWPAVANAHVFDTFGFSAQSEGLAGAMTAQASGYAGAHHNPAAVAALPEVQAALGYSYGWPRLTLDGRDARLSAVHGVSLGAALPVTLGPVRLAFGLALYVPDQYLLRVELAPASEPHFALLGANLQHLVATPVVALRLGDWLELGAGLTILSDIAGGVTFDVGAVAGEKVGQGELDVSLPTRLAAVAGVRLLPLPWLRVGMAYRDEIDLGLRLDVLARVNVADAVAGDVLISLRALSLYTPRKLSLGVAADPLPWLTLSLDVEWHNWAAFAGAVPTTDVQLALGVTPSIVRALFPAQRFRDIWVPRVGLELRRPLGPCVSLAGRLGYAFEPSPVPPQIGLTSLVDNDRHVIAFGLGAALTRLLPFLAQPLRLDLGLQLHQLVSKTTRKDPAFFPGAGFRSGGWLLHGTITLEARF